MAWTKEQQLAIDTRDRTLLVSAAAGSGKTATLTERIIKSILDEEKPADISRMLIVTYTNAAVDELRERIGRAIKKAAKENPDNPRLEEQYLKLKDAKILTITSFCNSILRMSAENVGLPPNYRIAEPAEAKILFSSVMDGLINAAFEGELADVCTADEFIELADSLCSARYADGLSESFSYVFTKLQSCAAGIDTVAPLLKEYDPDLFTSAVETTMGRYLISKIKEALSAYEAAYEAAIRIATDEPLDRKNMIRASGDLEFIKSALAEESYSALREVFANFKPKALTKHANDEITDFYLRLKQIRSYFSTDLKMFNGKFLTYSEDEWKELYTKLYNILGIFYKFLKKFYTVFMEEKRRRGICEFPDVERYAYEALYDENGERSLLADEISSLFDAIYIDEYQDVNELQNKVFAAISRDDNRFMVGDIKQSIYVFRSARPEIFAGMKSAFPMLGTEGDYPYASIFMSNNFRCDEGVIDFVNGIFDTMFGLLGESIGYVPEDKLKFSKIYPDGSLPVNHVPEIHIIEKAGAASSDDDSDEAEEEKITNAASMAKHIKGKIAELLKNGTLADGSRITPKDIAILMRSVKSPAAEAIISELKAAGIATRVADNGNLFMSNEVLLALSFLYSIDNPKKDIYLTALMCSPLYSFSADELVAIRKQCPADSVWDSLILYTDAHPEYEKGKSFIFSLKRYRRLCEGMPTDTLISFIYRESGLLALAAKTGGRDNLILLHSYAAKYEKSDFKGLYSFISYINAIIEKGEEYPVATAAEEEDAVSIMTVHKSKGLEFPVTIIANASASEKAGAEGRIIFSENFGIALKTKDDTGLALVDNPIIHLIQANIARSEYEEKLRVLYVALTRARERLYIYGICPKTSSSEYLDYIDGLRDIISPYFAAKAKTFLDIIMASKICGHVIIDEPLAESANTRASENQAAIEEKTDFEGETNLEAELLERFSFVYPLSHLEKLPEKISVSKLTPTILDGSDEGETALEDIFMPNAQFEDNSEETEEKPPILPAFMSGEASRESAERGIATHLMMQFCDFEKLEKFGTKAELQRLTEQKFISQEDANRVRCSEIDKFILSPLFSELKTAKKLYRELRFNLKLPAERFTEDEDKKQRLTGHEILVQGVIDCIIEDNDGNLHLIDYKTDRLTRAELASPQLAEERLCLTHSRQLSYYAEAVEKMFGKPPYAVGIYSLHLGKEVKLNLSVD